MEKQLDLTSCRFQAQIVLSSFGSEEISKLQLNSFMCVCVVVG